MDKHILDLDALEEEVGGGGPSWAVSTAQLLAVIGELRASRRVIEAVKAQHVYQYAGGLIDAKSCPICRALAELAHS